MPVPRQIFSKNISSRVGQLVGRVPMSSVDRLDQIFGLRAWGLVLYGALPASLSLLGILEVKLGSVDKLIPVLLVSLLPLVLTFLLIRARQKEWYFTADYLNFRSAFITLLIVVSSTLVAGASGIIRDKYVFSLRNITDFGHRAAMAESFLFGMASLVISSTVFATILTKGADLPGLPSTGFVSAMAKIRQQLIAIQNSSIWQAYDFAEGMQIFDDLKDAGNSLLKELGIAMSQPGHKLGKRSLQPLETEFLIFAESVSLIKKGGIKDTVVFRWNIHFADFTKFQNATAADQKKLDYLRVERENIQATYVALQKLKGLRLGGRNG